MSIDHITTLSGHFDIYVYIIKLLLFFLQMEKKRKRSKFLLRPKSPILMTTKRKMELIKANILSISDVDDLDTISMVLNKINSTYYIFYILNY